MDEKPELVSLADTEKNVRDPLPRKLAEFEDPDAGLSEEEKAAIVCSCSMSPLAFLYPNLRRKEAK